MFKNNCCGSDNTNFGCSLFLWGFPLPKVSSAKVQLCNQGSHCWEDSQGVRNSWETPHWETCLGLEPHLYFPSVLGQATLYVCMCPALYPANPNRDVLQWPPGFTLDLQLWAPLVGLRVNLVSRAALSSLARCHRAVPISEGTHRAASFFCSLALGLSFPCGSSTCTGWCNPSSRSLRRCLFIGLSGNLSVETSLGTCCYKSNRRCAGDSMPTESLVVLICNRIQFFMAHLYWEKNQQTDSQTSWIRCKMKPLGVRFRTFGAFDTPFVLRDHSLSKEAKTQMCIAKDPCLHLTSRVLPAEDCEFFFLIISIVEFCYALV